MCDSAKPLRKKYIPLGVARVAVKIGGMSEEQSQYPPLSLCCEDEEEEAERERGGQSGTAPSVGGAKRPRAGSLACFEQLVPSDSDEDVDDERPDLGEFFLEHGTPKREQVSLCRTYASYVASTLPKKRKVGARRRSPPK